MRGPALALVALLLTLAAVGRALAAPAGPPVVRIEARVHDDLQVITGTMQIDGAPGVRVLDPLALLPEPPDDRTALRTWPGARETGVVRFEAAGPARWTFVAILPRRWGDVGVDPGRALYANGMWYPQPMIGRELVVGLWSVTVDLPEGAVGALGDMAGSGRLAWFGAGERASLAVLRRGHVELLQADGISLSVVSRRRAPRAWRRRLTATVADLRPPETSIQAAVVRSPLRRRLARPGVGTLYLSDRAWRLTPGLRRYHDTAVARGLLQAGLSLPDPYSRELAAAALVRGRSGDAGNARGLLRWMAWNPVIDAILNDRTLPFWGDVFDAAHPEDPLRDDLLELLAPHGPGTALAAQLDALSGPAATFTLGAALARGASVIDAAAEADVPYALVEGWRQPYPIQDLKLIVDRNKSRLGVLREAPATAPPEVVVVRVDGEEQARVTSTGPDLLTFELDAPPRRVVVDPRGLVAQRSRHGDSWPSRTVLTSAAWIDQVNVTEGWFSGFASVWARGRDDTRNVFSAGASFDQQTLPALQVGWLHRRGPLQDGLNRPIRLSAWLEPAWTNPRFAEGDRPLLTIGGGAQAAWDTRVSGLFPLRGHRLWATATAGALPAEDTTWASLRLGAHGIAAPHPRLAFVGTTTVGIAGGDTAQRLLWLGGPGSLVSLAPAAAIGRTRAVASTQVRWAPVRHASVPLLGLAWLSEIQLSAGLEAGHARTLAGGDAAALGLTGGAALITDLLGASPSTIGVTVGKPIARRGLEGPPAPQITLQLGKAM